MSLGLLCLSSCTVEPVDAGSDLTATQLTAESSCDVLVDFNGLATGTVVSDVSSGSGISGMAVSGSIAVFGVNFTKDAGVNHAMIFDTDNPTGDDEDLVVPGEDHQEVLIISEDLDSSDPDDQAPPGGSITLDFSGFGPGVVDINSFVTIDNEEAGEWEAYAAGGALIASGPIASIANSTQQVITVNQAGVAKLTVTFNGSGALDEFCLSVEPEDPGCTYTQGFWKNEKKGPFPAPFNRDDVFFLSGMSWQEVLDTAPAGNAYYQAAHQYIAAALNVANGASSPEAVDDALALGTDLFNTYTPAEIGGLRGNNSLRKSFIAISKTLDNYNQGKIGPGHCDD